MQKLSVSESYKRRQENYSIPLIDVRTPAEYRANHATGSLNHPMESLDLNHLPFSKEEEVHVICQSGGRSIKVCKKMEAAGFWRQTRSFPCVRNTRIGRPRKGASSPHGAAADRSHVTPTSIGWRAWWAEPLSAAQGRRTRLASFSSRGESVERVL